MTLNRDQDTYHCNDETELNFTRVDNGVYRTIGLLSKKPCK